MKYVEKSLMSPYGVEAKVWLAVTLNAELWHKNMDPADPQPGSVVLLGWKDVAALAGGKAPMHTVTYKVVDASKLAAYPAMVTELVTKFVADPASPLYGGTVKDL